MNKSDQINELASALSKAQSQMLSAKKDSANPFFKSRYADLASVWEACRKPLTDNGLAVTQLVQGKELITILAHSSGQWISSSVELNPMKPDPQSLGSAISYMRRYSLAAIVGVVQEDDDAEGAMSRQKAEPIGYDNGKQVPPQVKGPQYKR